ALSLLVLVVVLGVFSVWLARMYNRSDAQLARVEQARQESLQFAARAAAEMIGKEIDKRVEILVAEARDEGLRSILAQQTDETSTAPDPDLQTWLTEMAEYHQKNTGAHCWFINDRW